MRPRCPGFVLFVFFCLFVVVVLLLLFVVVFGGTFFDFHYTKKPM